MPSVHNATLEILSRQMGDLNARPILELGSGNGELARRMRDAGASVTALDRTPLSFPRDWIDEYVTHDLGTGTLPFPNNSFDCVVATEVLEHLKAPFSILTEMVRVLSGNGLLLISVPN